MLNWLQSFLTEARLIFTAELLKFGTTPITLLGIIQIIISLGLVLFLSSLFKRTLKQNLLVRLKIDEGNREAIASIISYSIGTFGFLIILQTNGFNLASLAVLAGGLGVGIGLGLQEITKNFTSGLTLLIERKIKVGDFIEFDKLSGYVKEISLRSTIIRTREGGDVVVPNSQMVENRVINWSYDSYIARIHLPVGVAYGSDPILVTETLLNSAYNEPAVVGDPAPSVLFRGFGDNALNFELWVWVNRIDKEPFIKSSLYFSIEQNLRTHNISIPFPQRDLWIKNPQDLFGLTSQSSKHSIDNGDSEFKSPSPEQNKPLGLKELLQQVVYFKNFTDLEVRRLIEIGYRKRVRPTEILFREGDPGDAFYIILEGSVEVYVEAISKHLTNLEAGKFLGELALMLGIPRTATVRALEETVVFVINQKGFEKLLQDYPGMTEIIAQELGKHQEELSQRQQELRKLGLIDDAEDDKNPVQWMRKRLKKLFNLKFQ